VCPITAEIMADPVSTSDGFTYEREAIEAWLADHNTSPLTGAPLARNELIPNHALRGAIEHFAKASPQIQQQLYQPRAAIIRERIDGKQWATPATQASPDPPQGIPVQVSPADQPVAVDVPPDAPPEGVPLGKPTVSQAAAAAGIIPDVVTYSSSPTLGLTQSDAAFCESLSTRDWSAVKISRPGSSAARGGGLFSRSKSNSNSTTSTAALHADVSLGVSPAEMGGTSLSVEARSEAGFLHIAQRLAAPGSAPVAALKLSAQDGFGEGTSSASVTSDGEAFLLLTRALAASGGSDALQRLTELTITKIKISGERASALAAALLHHPTLTALELWNVDLNDEGALAISALAAPGGSFPLSRLNLGRNLISGHVKLQIEAAADPKRVSLSLF